MSEAFAAGQLRAFIERVERIEEEIADLNGDKSDLYKEAKGVGFDVSALREVVSIRRKRAKNRDGFDGHAAMVDLYLSTLGDAAAGIVRARVETIDEFDPDTGEIMETGERRDGEAKPISVSVGQQAGSSEKATDTSAAGAAQDRCESAAPTHLSGESRERQKPALQASKPEAPSQEPARKRPARTAAVNPHTGREMMPEVPAFLQRAAGHA